ncbi:MAG: glycosyltransferase family 4 protein [Candidatus Paracaedibacteraceae bacterium]|nr:glycosyltransferase family 4 protein [Candidatus Paracaedibacteraceae bacterium]
MPHKPIIIQLVPRFNSGGVERVTIDTAGFLANCDDAPTYVASQGGLLQPELEARGVHHITLPLATKNPIKIILNGFRLAKLVKELGIDLIHARSRAPAWSAWFASKLSGKPYIATYHGAYHVNVPLKNWYNSSMVRGKCVISISDFVTRLIQERHGNLNPIIHRIYPGVDAHGLLNPERFKKEDSLTQRKEWQIPDDAFVMLMLGRIAKAKRFDLAVQALGRLKDNPKLYLVLAGSDQGRTELSQSLLDLAQDLGVADRVRLVRDFKNIPLAYAVSDLVLFPTSHIETYGRITAEAGAMAKIVIACDIGAVAELIEEGKTGYVIPEADLDALVNRIEKVLAMPEAEKQAMEQNARRHILAHFTAERMYEETLALYSQI